MKKLLTTLFFGSIIGIGAVSAQSTILKDSLSTSLKKMQQDSTKWYKKTDSILMTMPRTQQDSMMKTMTQDQRDGITKYRNQVQRDSINKKMMKRDTIMKPKY